MKKIGRFTLSFSGFCLLLASVSLLVLTSISSCQTGGGSGESLIAQDPDRRYDPYIQLSGIDTTAQYFTTHFYSKTPTTLANISLSLEKALQALQLGEVYQTFSNQDHPWIKTAYFPDSRPIQYSLIRSDGFSYQLSVRLNEPDNGKPLELNFTFFKYHPINHPYGIYSPKDLRAIAFDLTGSYLQMGALDFQSETDFLPLGPWEEKAFQGSYDGQFLRISNLTIDQAQNWQGLFGVIKNARLKRIVLEKLSLSGKEQVGGLAGKAIDSSIALSSVEGTIEGKQNLGGLVGFLENSQIEQSFSQVKIRGESQLGGLVGTLFSGEVADAYSQSTLTAETVVGGLVGSNYDLIKNSYSVSQIEAVSSEGEIAGETAGHGKEENSYYPGTKQKIYLPASVFLDPAGRWEKREGFWPLLKSFPAELQPKISLEDKP